jgi:two-component system, cell cycle sensor histidine kinase and response regulator CckA
MSIPPHRPYQRPTEEARLRILRLSDQTHQPLTETLRHITRIAADTLGVERAGVWLYTDDRSAIRCVSLFERTPGKHSDGLLLRVADFPDYFAALAERRAIPAEVAAVDPRTAGLKRAYLDPLGITSLLDAPIYLHGQIVGIACHEHVGPPREWTTEERDFVASIADLIAMKMKGIEVDDSKAKPVASDSVIGRHGDESFAHFVAGLAHDLRNLLTIVVGNADLIATDPMATVGIRQKSTNILSAADRSIALANEFNEISGKRAGRPRILCASEEVQNLLPVLRGAAGPDHPIVFHNRSPGDRIFADPVQLERILVNLVINARDATPDGGPIEVIVADGAPSVEITVRDRGTGIDPDVKNRVFDPFFTTKPKGKGTGIGLTVVRRMVDLLGGTIEIDSSLGSGTTVRVTIPLAGSA